MILYMLVLQQLSKSAHSTHPELIQTVTAAMHTAAHSLAVNVGGAMLSQGIPSYPKLSQAIPSYDVWHLLQTSGSR